MHRRCELHFEAHHDFLAEDMLRPVVTSLGPLQTVLPLGLTCLLCLFLTYGTNFD